MGDFKTQDLKALFKKAIKAVGPPCKKGAKVVGSGCKKGWAKVRHHLIKKWWKPIANGWLPCQQPSFSILSASMNYLRCARDAWKFPSNQKMLGFLHFNFFTIKLIWFFFIWACIWRLCCWLPIVCNSLGLLSSLSFLSDFLRVLPEFSWDFLWRSKINQLCYESRA